MRPVLVSPLAMAQAMGAAPRYFGSREACRLIQPRRGMSIRRARNDLPVGDDHHGVRRDLLEKFKRRVGLNLFGLVDVHAGFERSFFDRRSGNVLPAAARAVRLRDHGFDA